MFNIFHNKLESKTGQATSSFIYQVLPLGQNKTLLFFFFTICWLYFISQVLSPQQGKHNQLGMKTLLFSTVLCLLISQCFIWQMVSSKVGWGRYNKVHFAALLEHGRISFCYFLNKVFNFMQWIRICSWIGMDFDFFPNDSFLHW